MTDDELIRRKEIFRVCQTREELRDWVYVFLDLELPGSVVDVESNTSLLDMAWECYAHFTGKALDPEVSRALYYSARDAGKTLTQSVIEVLALIHLDVSVVHLAAIAEQSKNAQRYLKKFLTSPDFARYVYGDNVRETSVILYRPIDHDGVVLSEDEFRALDPELQPMYKRIENRAEIVVATMQSVNGKHAGILCLDEIDVMENPTVYAQTVNIPTAIRRKDGTTQMPLTILTSTRKTAFGLVQDEIDRAEETKLKIRHFNILDVTERCPPERHKPDLPKLKLYVAKDELKHTDEFGFATLSQRDKEKYIEAEGFEGCKNCKIFSSCQTRLATHQTGDSRFLKPLQHVINQFRNNSLETALAELLSRKPSSTGLIYPRFSLLRHVLSPAQAYLRVFGELPDSPEKYTKAELKLAIRERECEWKGGVDWGHTHNFVYTMGFKDGLNMYITDCLSIAGLEPDQMLEVSEPFREFGPTTYADTADPKMTKYFKRHGHRMATWSKGTVVGGIDTVRWKLNPPMGEPELFLVRDIGEDPDIDRLIKKMREYHWKLGADGKPTDVPDPDGDDENDGLRYLIMNVFSPKGKMAIVREDTSVPISNIIQPVMGAGYDPDHWARQIISERTGKPMEEAPQPERRMTISAPKNSGKGYSYYEEENKPVVGKKGRKGRFGFDFS